MWWEGCWRALGLNKRHINKKLLGGQACSHPPSPAKPFPQPAWKKDCDCCCAAPDPTKGGQGGPGQEAPLPLPVAVPWKLLAPFE